MIESDARGQEESVCGAWQGTLQAALGVFLLAIVALVAHYYPTSNSTELEQQLQTLNHEVQQLKQEQTMPELVLNRYRDSICYIYGVYQVGFDGHPPEFRARVSGSGFVVANGFLATNRHVAEPWFQDPDSAVLIRKGAKPHLEKLLAFFPGLPQPINVTAAALSAEGDLAVLHIEDSQAVRRLRPLPLAENPPNPGELVSVVGYPMGVLGMVAKSPPAIYERLAYRRDDQGAASELAALSLIRPSATCGHLGDVVGDKLIYDAPTAHGASGGPVFNSQGEVLGVNAAYLDGFSGGTLGVSVRALKPLILTAEANNRRKLP
ncbi:MAG TPA: serine protease [Terriglobales bacterium]|nr:serine protease [Terriglobales bacterium]